MEGDKKVKIESQIWMAENLNYAGKEEGPELGMCHSAADPTCENYGRLYDWETVMASASSSSANPSGVQGICPAGWHLPSDAEWEELVSVAGGTEVAGGRLKSKSLWVVGPGTDDFGFAALPSGNGTADGSSVNVGSRAGWWTATADANAARAYRPLIQSTDGFSVGVTAVKTLSCPVRCVQN